MIQDQVFLQGENPDPFYQKRRENLLLIGINCHYSSDNCFCVSAANGPKIQEHADMIFSEIDQGFIIEHSNDKATALLAALRLERAHKEELDTAAIETQQAADAQQKSLPFDNKIALRDTVFEALHHPQWDAVAKRCLSCGNCTSACPTCFCHTQSEQPDISGDSSTHQREWDSCFNAGHSYFARSILRGNTKERYRQWLSHKVASWFDQFGRSGCVGCGRCMTWCPSGIDITEELAILAKNTEAPDASSSHD